MALFDRGELVQVQKAYWVRMVLIQHAYDMDSDAQNTLHVALPPSLVTYSSVDMRANMQAVHSYLRMC